MNKRELAKQYLSERDREIYIRSLIKMENSYAAIGRDLWISRQRVEQVYLSCCSKIKRISESLEQNQDEFWLNNTMK